MWGWGRTSEQPHGKQSFHSRPDPNAKGHACPALSFWTVAGVWCLRAFTFRTLQTLIRPPPTYSLPSASLAPCHPHAAFSLPASFAFPDAQNQWELAALKVPPVWFSKGSPSWPTKERHTNISCAVSSPVCLHYRQLVCPQTLVLHRTSCVLPCVSLSRGRGTASPTR